MNRPIKKNLLWNGQPQILQTFCALLDSRGVAQESAACARRACLVLRIQDPNVPSLADQLRDYGDTDTKEMDLFSQKIPISSTWRTMPPCLGSFNLEK